MAKGYNIRIPAEFKPLLQELAKVNMRSPAEMVVYLALGRAYRQGLPENLFPIPPTVSVEVVELSTEQIQCPDRPIRNVSVLGDK